MQSPYSPDPLIALAAHYQAMPPVASMRVSIGGYDGERLCLSAPLAAHVNDKGCAFGGSLVSLMTLAGWGLLSLRIAQASMAADIFVADSQVRYRAPLWGDLQAVAQAQADWNDFLGALRMHGRARIAIAAHVPLPEGGDAARMQAQYVAIAKR